MNFSQGLGLSYRTFGFRESKQYTCEETCNRIIQN